MNPATRARILTDLEIIADDAPPARLRAFWIDRGVVDPQARWSPLAGGRTNAVWKVGTDPGAQVCKLFRPGATTPLFANDPAAEALALTALSGTGIAPALVAAANSPLGESLVYTHVAGAPWRGDVAPVAALLRRLHDHGAPQDLPGSATGAARLIGQGRAILTQIGDAGEALAALEPALPAAEPAPAPVFLHGDVVPGNLLAGPEGALTLIDWQCPSRGEACDDLALFLSPGMQHAYGNPPLSAADEVAFLAAYGDGAAAARYRTLAPAYHWRMAAYCLWKARMGDGAYLRGAELEIEWLGRLSGMGEEALKGR